MARVRRKRGNCSFCSSYQTMNSLLRMTCGTQHPNSITHLIIVSQAGATPFTLCNLPGVMPTLAWACVIECKHGHASVNHATRRLDFAAQARSRRLRQAIDWLSALAGEPPVAHALSNARSRTVASQSKTKPSICLWRAIVRPTSEPHASPKP